MKNKSLKRDIHTHTTECASVLSGPATLLQTWETATIKSFIPERKKHELTQRQNYCVSFNSKVFMSVNVFKLQGSE